MAGYIYSFSPTLNLTPVYSGLDHAHSIKENYFDLKNIFKIQCVKYRYINNTCGMYIYRLSPKKHWVKDKKKDLSIEDSFG